jgi:hypothetical protein
MNPASQKHDPIVAEIHAARERLAEEYHNDLLAYSEAAEAHCHALGFRFAESPRRQAMQDAPLCKLRPERDVAPAMPAQSKSQTITERSSGRRLPARAPSADTSGRDSADFWLGLQQDWDLRRAIFRLKPLAAAERQLSLLTKAVPVLMLAEMFLKQRCRWSFHSPQPTLLLTKRSMLCQSKKISGFATNAVRCTLMGIQIKGGSHEAVGFNFVLPHDVLQSLIQQGYWRFCQKCNAIFFDGSPLNHDVSANKGLYAAGGGHEAAGFFFVLPHDNRPEIQLDQSPVRMSGVGFMPYAVVRIIYRYEGGTSHEVPIEVRADNSGKVLWCNPQFQLSTELYCRRSH